MKSVCVVLVLLYALSVSPVRADDVPPPDATLTIFLCDAPRGSCPLEFSPVAGQWVCVHEAHVTCERTNQWGLVTVPVRSGLVSITTNLSVGWQCTTPRGWGYCQSVVFVAPYSAQVLIWGVKFSGWRLWLPLSGMDKGNN